LQELQEFRKSNATDQKEKIGRIVPRQLERFFLWVSLMVGAVGAPIFGGERLKYSVP
jgi:hypothetical protein